MGAPPDLIAEHAENCLLLWPVRQVATRLPHLGLAEIARRDERLLAHLDGLRLAGGDGLDVLLESAPAEPGAAWAATILAAEQGRLADLPQAGCLPLALWWMEGRHAEGALTLWENTAPALAQEAAAILGRPRSDRVAAVRSADPVLAKAACRAASMAGDRRAAESALLRIGDRDPEVAWEARRTAALVLGDAGAAEHLRDGPSLTDRILAARCGASLLASGRAGILAIAAAGTREQVPALIARMTDPALARAAGEAFTAITGCDLVRERLAAAAPAAGRESVSADPAVDDTALDDDEDLPWPDADRVAAWWEAHAKGLPAGRLLAGRSVAEARAVLAEGTQRLRWAACIELMRAESVGLFPWAEAPVSRQRELLAGAAP